MGNKSGPGGGRCMLVIEDDVAIRELLAELLVEIVGDGVTFVAHPDEVAPGFIPDVILSDLVGPDPHRVDAGVAYLQALRERFRESKILVVTAQAWVITTGRSLPVDELIRKPFDLEHLAERVAFHAGVAPSLGSPVSLA